MKLYFSPAACSLAVHITLEASGLPYELERVDLSAHTTASGKDYYTINPKGYVPTLEVDEGERLTEASVVLQYVADRKPGILAPVFGSMARYHLMEWLNFIATELHKGVGPLWNPKTGEEQRMNVVQALGRRLDYVAKSLSGRAYLTGDAFTIADAYLFVILNWRKALRFDLDRWPILVQYAERVAALPAVRAAMKAEGLLDEA
ncbi:MAG TPA: glutathione transferase GstA [Casimicrobiaceae bacterium]|nr:glutathione transferase GstA [Casimicrobiaceae bacterium]